jgi:hypothetical protein
MAGAGLAWQVTPRVQLDGSFRHRLGGHADPWEAGLGVSVYFGHEGLCSSFRRRPESSRRAV